MVRNIIKNSNTYLTALAMCAAIASCTSDENIVQEGEGSSTSTCDVKEKQSSDELGSRSSLNFSSKGLVFAWTKGDEMTVMAKDDNRARQIYTLDAGEGEPNATFVTENFKPKKDQMYFAFGNSESNNKHVKIPDQNNITVDYSGQVQVGNASTVHLGDYDFLAAGALCESQDEMHFSFSHLGATFRVVMAFDTSESAITNADERNALMSSTDGTETEGALSKTRFTEMEVYDSENSFRQAERNFSFATGTDGNKYTFAWPEQEITKMDRFKLTLKNTTEAEADKNSTAYTGRRGITRDDAFLDGSGTNNNRKVIAYIEVPPADFTNKKIGIMLKGYYEKYEDGLWKKHDVSYVQTYDKGWTFGGVKTYVAEAGRACQIGSLTMKKPEKFDISLKVNHMWQHGSTLDQTALSSKAGTGDPGYDKEIVTPTHIYYIYCHDGKVVKPTSTGEVVTHITASGTSDWDTKNTDGVWTSTYKGGTNNGIITLDKPECKKSTKDEKCEYHLYAVASTSELTISANVGDSEETLVRKLTYDLPASDVQTFMRDLYSTPWDATNFVGDITDPVQDVTLYHVAAKVDLKWNSATAIKSVSANDVKKQELYIFKPTENTGGIVSSGYTETFSLADNVDQWYNGRYVLYLPQFTSDCSYKVGLNTEVETITFTSVSTQGGFTSWLRWLKQK